MTTTEQERSPSWQPARLKSSSSRGEVGTPDAGVQRAAARTGGRARAMLAALTAPLRNPAREVGVSDGPDRGRESLWEMRPKSLAELWADVRNSDVVEGDRHWALEAAGNVAGAVGLVLIAGLRGAEFVLVLQKPWRLVGAVACGLIVYFTFWS